MLHGFRQARVRSNQNIKRAAWPEPVDSLELLRQVLEECDREYGPIATTTDRASVPGRTVPPMQLHAAHRPADDDTVEAHHWTLVQRPAPRAP